MKTVYPDYYPEFRCIAGQCRHNCCIGWEIDIDEEKLACYDAVPGPMGERLRRHICREGQPHFILGEGERCPFLNDENLCDIILKLGEDHICQICTDHPRFYHQMDTRLEVGLGLCCEEAGRRILGHKEPVKLLSDGGGEEEEEPVLALRDRALALLQRRQLSLEERGALLLQLCGADGPHRDMGRWAQFLLGLERLDEGWTALMENLSRKWREADLAAFEAYLGQRITEYEQLMVYLVYRHLVDAWDDTDLAARASFAVLGYELLRHLGALQWQERGEFTFEDQVELGRLFSSEIEYSEENLELVLASLLPAWAGVGE